MNLFNLERTKQHLSLGTSSTVKRNTVNMFNVLFQTRVAVGNDEQGENAN